MRERAFDLPAWSPALLRKCLTGQQDRGREISYQRQASAHGPDGLPQSRKQKSLRFSSLEIPSWVIPRALAIRT